MDKEQLLFNDYEHTLVQYRMLADIRFKLLAFVPTFTGAGIALLPGNLDPGQALLLGLLGWWATLGIIFYEVRNTQFYDAAVHRAKELEARLELPVCTAGKTTGGLFSEKPSRTLALFGIFSIWHDRGLAMIYGAAMGGWSFLALNAALGLLGVFSLPVSLSLALVIGVALGYEIIRLSQSDQPKPAIQPVSGEQMGAAQ